MVKSPCSTFLNAEIIASAIRLIIFMNNKAAKKATTKAMNVTISPLLIFF